MRKLAILSSLLLLALNSCSNEDIITEELPNNYEKRITVVAEDLTPAEGTRTSYTDNGNGYSFAWSEGDALGIFPTSGHQTDFPIGTDGVGSNTAVFDGGKWALRPNESYAAYYPLIEDFKLNSTAIPVNYTGQVQDGNGSTDHIGKYDFMASTFTDVDAKGNVNFRLQHLGCLVQFKFTMPEADTYTKLEIVSSNDDFITSAKYSLSDNSHTFKDIQKSNKVTIGLNNVSTTADNKNITITAMFAPVDLSGKTLTLSLKGRSEVYTFEVEGQNLPKGNAVNNTSEIVDDTPYVTFLADAEQTLKLRYYGGMSEITTIEYSVNNGEWKHLGASTDAISFGGNYGNIRLRGVSSIGTSTSAVLYSTIVFGIEGVNVSSYGDIRTLVDYENYATANTENARFINLFRNCKVLTSTPNLYATSLASSCYFSMFADCTSLTSAPELSATTLASSCYYGMFRGCTSLTKAPELPALSLVNECYSTMFSGCTSLNYVKMMATDISAMKCLGNWLYKGSTTGTFIKNSAATWDVTGASGIPEGWTVKYVDENGNEVDKTPYVTFHAEAEQTFSMYYPEDRMPVIESLQYSVDGGEWATVEKNTDWMVGTNTITFGGEHGDLRLRAKSKIGTAILDPDYPNSGDIYKAVIRFHKDNVKVSSCGDLRTLVDYENYANADMTEARFCNLFGGCLALTSAPKLPSTTLAEYCYSSMFNGCSALTSAPELPAYVLSESCYSNMFSGCSALTTAPELSAETLAPRCYNRMFVGCSSLTNVPSSLPAPILKEACYYGMFNGCIKLANAPKLPATTLANSCYSDMFSGCKVLTIAPELPATTLTDYCYYNMFNGCTKLNSVKMMATDISATWCTTNWLYNVSSTGTFVKNSRASWSNSNVVPAYWTVELAIQ